MVYQQSKEACPRCAEGVQVRPTLPTRQGTFWYCDECGHMWLVEIKYDEVSRQK